MAKLTMGQLDSYRKTKSDRQVIRVGMSSCGIAAGAKEVYNRLKQLVEERHLDIEIVQCGCAGMCYAEPLVEVVQQKRPRFFYGNVNEKVAEEIINGVANNTLDSSETLRKLELMISDKQMRIVLRNCGIVDPERLEDYLAEGGYEGLKKVLTENSAQAVVDVLKKSGLRGRGGAGFPTWMKWNFARGIEADEKYVICNGDEGDPGAYMDRSVLEGDPFSVLEGMTIAGFCIGSKKGILYIRAEYPLAVDRIQKAIEKAREYGLLGEHVLGSSFSFDLEIRLGAGAFVCGEETALIASIEGKRGCPVPRPPYPSVKGLWGKPTVINNVETLANVPAIFSRGADWFAGVGSETSKGTKVFAVTGKVKNTGLVEVPMGITLREIVFDIAGGAINGRKIKAIQTGGPSGGVIPEQFFDTAVDYEQLQKLGSIMGSGGMIVMDEDDCMIDIAKFYLGFCVDESCGKCAPCRIGGTQLLSILTDISKGEAQLEDLDKLKRISFAMQKASLCGLGQTASNPVLSTLQYFEEEYRKHIVDKKCPSGKCKDLLQFKIDPDKCRRCTLCQRNCPAGAIAGDRDKGFWIVDEKCVRCGKCFEVCKFNAVQR